MRMNWQVVQTMMGISQSVEPKYGFLYDPQHNPTSKYYGYMPRAGSQYLDPMA